MKSLMFGFLVLLLSLTSWATSESSRHIPRNLGNSLALATSENSFVQHFHVSPVRCASCYNGEKLAQISLEDPSSILKSLKLLGLSITTRPEISVYFDGGSVSVIHIENLESSDALSVLNKKFGRGRVLQESKEILEIEWQDARTRLRLTKWESEFQLTLAERTSKSKVTSTQKR